MRRLRAAPIALLITLGTALAIAADNVPGGLARWGKDVRIYPVLADAERHSIHSYFNTSPESPDGRQVLLYTSTTREGHEGEVWTVERTTGKTTVLARGVVVEDAHRAACQQWLSGGRRVVFHDYRKDQWVVVCVDAATGEERVLAERRQVGWGTPGGDVVPLYGPHSRPGSHRDLELLNVRTGEISTAVTAAAVRAAYPREVEQRFGDRPISVFFPILSPDQSKVIFKLATPAGGDFRSKDASDREGLVCYDLHAGKFLWMRDKWGHPAWNPDSGSLINYDGKGLYEIDARTGTVRRKEGLAVFPGSHPSWGPDGILFATDFIAGEGKGGVWGVAVGTLQTGDYQILHRFDNSRGSSSWRRSHPHPSFSHDGRRVYFNVSADRWTRLFVAECAGN